MHLIEPEGQCCLSDYGNLKKNYTFKLIATFIKQVFHTSILIFRIYSINKDTVVYLLLCALIKLTGIS